MEGRRRAKLAEMEAKKLRIRDYNRATEDHLRAHGIPVDGGELDDDEYANSDERLLAVTRTRRFAPVFLSAVPNESIITQEEREEFLRNLSETFNWNQSAYMVGRSGASFRALAKADPFFGAMIAEAVQDFKEGVFAETYHRAVKGVAKPVFSSQLGCKIGEVIEKSDRLLELILKGVDKRFRENGGVNVNIQNNADARSGVMVVPGVAKSDEEFAASRDLVEAQRRTLQAPARVIKRRSEGA